MRVAGTIGGLLSIAIGLYNLISISLDPRTVINAVYSIIFGILMIICEARAVFFLKYFFFLRHFLGLGAFYIFVGGLALNDTWWQAAVGGIILALGVIYFMLGLACRRMGHEAFPTVDQPYPGGVIISKPGQPPVVVAPGTTVVITGNGGAPMPVPGSPTSPTDNPDGVYRVESAYGNSNIAPSWAEPAAITAARENASAYSSQPQEANPFDD